MAAPTRATTGTGKLVFVFALGVSALGHFAALRARSDAEPHPINDNATGWSADEDAVQVFDAPSVTGEPPAAEEASGPDVQPEEGAPNAAIPKAELPTKAPATTPPRTRPAKTVVAKQKIPSQTAAPPTDLPEIATPDAVATDEPQLRPTDDQTSQSARGETDIEEGVITPRENWRAPPATPHSPSLSGVPTHPSSAPPAAPAEAQLAPGVARLETAFTRSVPYYNYADPAWDQLPLGRVGSMMLTFVVDGNGQILEATTRDSPAPVLERLRRRTLFGLRRGHFAIAKAQVTAGRRTLRIDVFLEQRPVGSQALPAVGFRAPMDGRPGVATMHLESGRFVTVQVLTVDD